MTNKDYLKETVDLLCQSIDAKRGQMHESEMIIDLLESPIVTKEPLELNTIQNFIVCMKKHCLYYKTREVRGKNIEYYTQTIQDMLAEHPEYIKVFQGMPHNQYHVMRYLRQESSYCVLAFIVLCAHYDSPSQNTNAEFSPHIQNSTMGHIRKLCHETVS